MLLLSSRIRRGKQKHVWHGKLLRLLKLLALIVFIGIDVVHTVTMSRMNNISVVAHMFGFIGGLLSAVSLIRDRPTTLQPKGKHGFSKRKTMTYL